MRGDDVNAALRRVRRPAVGPSLRLAAACAVGAAIFSAATPTRPARAQDATRSAVSEQQQRADVGDSVAAEARRVAGRVIRPGGDSVVPVSAVWVTIHRVGPDGAGPLDSTRTDGAGRYAFAYRASGSERAVYFVSASYGGIAYFSQPLTEAAVAGDAAEITVFDTTSHAVPVTVRGRHMIVFADTSGRGRRQVVEVYDLSNDSTVTAVSDEGARARPTWTAVVPAEARDFAVGQGDVPPTAARMGDGRVEVYAPFAPGLKQFAFSYTLPDAAFPLSIPMERPTSVLEILVEGQGGAASGAKLREVNPVHQQGRNFRRFLGQDVAQASVARVELAPVAFATRRALYVAVLIVGVGAAMLLALARAAGRGRRSIVDTVAASRSAANGGAPVVTADPERLAREIAALDAAFDRQRAPTDDARSSYQRRRDALKRDLTAALAAREGRG
ncbi:MAG TPA: hypothetical protein VFJ74_01600 [Gemmatimonadaceae bacterium]|nr:hypothetical protein [Gemmatimonadaceae bacterium]